MNREKGGLDEGKGGVSRGRRTERKGGHGGIGLRSGREDYNSG